MNMSLEEAYKDLIFILGSENVKKIEEDRKPYLVVKPTSAKYLSLLFSLAEKHNIRIDIMKSVFHGLSDLKPHCELLVDLSQLNKIINVDSENLTVTVEPGISFGTLSKLLASNGFQLGLEPIFSENVNVGEFIAQNGVGYGSLMYGSISNLVRDLEILLPNGSVIHTGFDDASSYATGYNFTNLFIGSFCSFGIITKATLDIFAKPESTNTIVFSSQSIESLFEMVKDALKKVSTVSSAFMVDKAFIEKLSVYLPEIRSEEFLGVVRLQGMKEIVQQEADLIKTTSDALHQVGDKLWSFRFLSTLKETFGDIIFDEYIIPTNKNIDTYYVLKEFSSKFKVKSSFYSLQVNPRKSLIIFIFQSEDLNKADYSILQKNIASLGGIPYPANLLTSLSTRLFLKFKKIFDSSGLLSSMKMGEL